MFCTQELENHLREDFELASVLTLTQPIFTVKTVGRELIYKTST